MPSSIILMQTDTTVGFISQNHKKLAKIKSRSQEKPFIKIYNNLNHSQLIQQENYSNHPRVPTKYKKKLRRASKTTFIIKNTAFRISSFRQNSQILRNIDWHYSTSANESNKNFNREYCEQNTDIIIEDYRRLQEFSASRLIKLTNHKRRKLR